MGNFESLPGPGLIARLRVCRPGEQLLWAVNRTAFYLDVEGLDAVGNPSKSLLGRGVRAVGRGVGGFTLDVVGAALLGGDDVTGLDKPPPPDHLLFGPGPGCLAHQAVPSIPFAPGKRGVVLWVLTAQRLVVARTWDPEPAAEPRKSLLGKAVSFGKGVVDFGVDAARIIAGSHHDHGRNTSGQPVPLPEVTVLHEFPRARIASITPFARESRPCLRVSFVDGSGVDFLFPDEGSARRALDLTNGAR
ncbi:hypothetical protein ABZ816_25970 [Actinosynnema sp. NPDC047251]|uniref:Uncharacterized protein n=1 Tax=Saccharothrix espanaensis (strain ATCC 51144 / DSM 44229 / JCM 9112 / NBRC 15066 / NRRL 15764) TaxID=1179773 RepID=K0K5M1_SACES|nr:hypothetical protein [Saccharothrix espanaensis]CCH31858.1 hypothetical protein BN6_45790 [Saccharothrix espanaensis DSM 44229]